MRSISSVQFRPHYKLELGFAVCKVCIASSGRGDGQLRSAVRGSRKKMSTVVLHVFRYLDGRVWPEEDERQVKLLFAFIHHVTGEPTG